MDVRLLAEKLEQMPVPASNRRSRRVSERITEAREVLKAIVQNLWKRVLANARWRSPLLVMVQRITGKPWHRILRGNPIPGIRTKTDEPGTVAVSAGIRSDAVS